MAIARSMFKPPERIAVLALSGVVLMPQGHLPFNIFEPRYLNMIDDALAHERIIALVQPRKPVDDPVPNDVPLYDVGTAGRIFSFVDPGNGHYQITLEGLTRFRVQSENNFDEKRGYRTVTADYSTFANDLLFTETEEGPERGRILELLRDYFTDKGIEADWTSVSDAPYESLVSSLVMTCPFEPGEKQGLLECQSHAQRAQMLISLFEMSLEGGEPTGGLTH